MDAWTHGGMDAWRHEHMGLHLHIPITWLGQVWPFAYVCPVPVPCGLWPVAGPVAGIANSMVPGEDGWTGDWAATLIRIYAFPYKSFIQTFPSIIFPSQA
jgi:hypothetical protein